MKRFVMIVFMVLFLCSIADATIISGEHYLSNGKKVNLSDLEWLSLHNTLGIPREYVLEDYPGSAHIYDGYSDWRFATLAETEALLDSLWGYIAEGWHETNFAGADWFFNNFGLTDGTWNFGREDYARFYYGSDSEVQDYPGNGTTFVGEIYRNIFEDEYRDLYPNDLGWFTDSMGLSSGLTPDNTRTKSNGWDFTAASLLVRDVAPIPEPTTILLLSTGLIGIICSRRLSKKQIMHR